MRRDRVQMAVSVHHASLQAKHGRPAITMNRPIRQRQANKTIVPPSECLKSRSFLPAGVRAAMIMPLRAHLKRSVVAVRKLPVERPCPRSSISQRADAVRQGNRQWTAKADDHIANSSAILGTATGNHHQQTGSYGLSSPQAIVSVATHYPSHQKAAKAVSA